MESQTMESQTAKQNTEIKPWAIKTSPPNKSIVALTDAAESNVMRNWRRVRMLECLPAITWRAKKAIWLDELPGMELDDVIQSMVIIAQDHAENDPTWWTRDNSLIAFDAKRRLQGKRHKQIVRHENRYLAGSLDATDAGQADRIIAGLVGTDLTYYGNRPTHGKGNAFDRSEIAGPHDTDTIIARSDILTALDKLTPEDKSLVLCNALVGQTVKDWAEKRQTPHASARTRLRRAKQQLAETLKDYDPANDNALTCPDCGNRNLRTKYNKPTCPICGKTGQADEFTKTGQPYATGRPRALDTRLIVKTYNREQWQTGQTLPELAPRTQDDDEPTMIAGQGWTPGKARADREPSQVLPPHKPALPDYEPEVAAYDRGQIVTVADRRVIADDTFTPDPDRCIITKPALPHYPTPTVPGYTPPCKLDNHPLR